MRRTIVEICQLCFQFAKGATRCSSIEFAATTCSTSWPPDVHFALNTTTVLQAQNSSYSTVQSTEGRGPTMDRQQGHDIQVRES